MVAVSGFQTIGVDNLTPHIGAEIDGVDPVSYTHLTLPTIYSV